MISPDTITPAAPTQIILGSTSLPALGTDWRAALAVVNGPACTDEAIQHLLNIETQIEEAEATTPAEIALKMRVLLRQAAVADDDDGSPIFGEMERLGEELTLALAT